MNDVFSALSNPSHSWIQNAGVSLKYTPEDTLKSFIQSFQKDSPDDSPIGAPPAAPKSGKTINDRISQTSTKQMTSKPKKCTKKPEPKNFLRRGQGRAAWSSNAVARGLSIKAPVTKTASKKGRIEEKSVIKPVPELRGVLTQSDQLCDRVPDGCNAVRTSFDERRELEEFELLERFAAQDIQCEVDESVGQNNNAAASMSALYSESGIDSNFSAPPYQSNVQRKIARFQPKIQVGRYSDDDSPPDFIPPKASTCFESDDDLVDDQLSNEVVTAKLVPAVAEPVLDIPRASPLPPSHTSQQESDLNLPKLQKLEADGRVIIQTESLRTWIERLEAEVKRFHSQNAALEKSRREYERSTAELDANSKRFSISKQQEHREFELYREQELKRLRKEKKVLDDYQKAMHSMPSKKDREEMDRLRKEIQAMSEESSAREAKLSNQLTHCRKRVQELEQERNELRCRISRLEHESLQWQAKYAALEEQRKKPATSSERSHSDFLLPSTVDQVAASLVLRNHHEVRQLMPEATTVPSYSVQQHREAFSPASVKEVERENLPLPNTFPRSSVSREIRTVDGSKEILYTNGLKVIEFSNGSVKEIFPDGKTAVVALFNGDMKQTLPDGRVIYTYASDGSVQTTHPDGTEDIVFADGRKEVNSKPSSTSSVSSERPSVTTFPSGTVVKRKMNGEKEILMPDGQVEIHCSEFKRRIYPDGNIKTVYANGNQETCYASGRVRVKDKFGNLIMDTKTSSVSSSQD